MKIKLKNTPAIVSFTYDDAPLSAFTNGGKILEAYGYRGTYYISSGLIGSLTSVGRVADLDTIRDYFIRGHEIGNHTYDHLHCHKSGFWQILRSIGRNRRKLKGIISSSFAYPYGAVDCKTRIATSLLSTSARGISFGINRNAIDRLHLKAARIYNRDAEDRCVDLINECATRGGWLIFYTHDVCEKPSEYGCNPERLHRIVRAVSDHKLRVATVGKAFRLIEQESEKE
jgi:peptidoglycan/xylan/chitin deacetylase (PgdA/CDA1 family)